jgi:hypothetical protein
MVFLLTSMMVVGKELLKLALKYFILTLLMIVLPICLCQQRKLGRQYQQLYIWEMVPVAQASVSADSLKSLAWFLLLRLTRAISWEGPTGISAAPTGH